MGTFANIACKTVGVAGMSAVIYDAYTRGKSNSQKQAQAVSADYFEKIQAQTRGLNNNSNLGNATQKKVKDLRMNNPLIPMVGSTKGFISGFFNSLGDNILPVAFSALAISTKGFFSKLGAVGVGLCGLYTIASEGFGFGKKSPIE